MGDELKLPDRNQKSEPREFNSPNGWETEPESGFSLDQFSGAPKVPENWSRVSFQHAKGFHISP